MPLHRLIPDEELPACLKRPLVFGDDEQISAVYDLEARIEKMEAESCRPGRGMHAFRCQGGGFGRDLGSNKGRFPRRKPRKRLWRRSISLSASSKWRTRMPPKPRGTEKKGGCHESVGDWGGSGISPGCFMV